MKTKLILLCLIILLIVSTVLLNNSSFDQSGDRVVAFVTTYSSLFAVYGIYLAYEQFVESKNQSKKELEILQAEKSIGLASDFQILIRDCYGISRILSTNDNYTKLVSELNYNDIKTFRISELEDNFKGQEDRNTLLNIVQSLYDNFNETYSTYDQVYNLAEVLPEDLNKAAKLYNNSQWNFSDLSKKMVGESLNLDSFAIRYQEVLIGTDAEMKDKYSEFVKTVTDGISIKKILVSEIENKFDTLLNKMEVFSMAINVGLADESPLYPSIHQSFLDTVRILHPRISKQNYGKHADHLYINLRDLYKLWSERYILELSKEKSEEYRPQSYNKLS